MTALRVVEYIHVLAHADSISRNRALHGDVVCVLLDKPVTQSNTSENVSSFEKPSPLDQFLTSGTINTTFEFEVKMRAPSGRVVAIEHLADRPEIFMIPKREELKQAINESSHYVLFHPRFVMITMWYIIDVFCVI